jgi:hypothetical protein
MLEKAGKTSQRQILCRNDSEGEESFKIDKDKKSFLRVSTKWIIGQCNDNKYFSLFLVS